jgi:hypothetical protein
LTGFFGYNVFVTVKVKDNLAYRRIAGKLFIVDAGTSRLHELNGPAALIWEGLAAGKSESGIVCGICEEFEVSEKKARADLPLFIKDLAGAGLLDQGV